MFRNKSRGIWGRVIKAINEKIEEVEIAHDNEQKAIDDNHIETMSALVESHNRAKQSCTANHVNSILSRII